jgi:hypothetical protein
MKLREANNASVSELDAENQPKKNESDMPMSGNDQIQPGE